MTPNNAINSDVQKRILRAIRGTPYLILDSGVAPP